MYVVHASVLASVLVRGWYVFLPHSLMETRQTVPLRWNTGGEQQPPGGTLPYPAPGAVRANRCCRANRSPVWRTIAATRVDESPTVKVGTGLAKSRESQDTVPHGTGLRARTNTPLLARLHPAKPTSLSQANVRCAGENIFEDSKTNSGRALCWGRFLV